MHGVNKEVCWGVGGGQGSCGKRYGGVGGDVGKCFGVWGEVTTLSNLKMPYTVMVPTIALYHSGVGAVVSPVSFFISPSYVCFLFFFTLF